MLVSACGSTIQVTDAPADAGDSGIVEPGADSSMARAFSRLGWKTEFSSASVPLSEIQAGGPSRDGIPPLDRPAFVIGEAARGWLKPNEPVVVVQVNDIARVYPVQILLWHEIVNDTIGDVPVTVTYSPLTGFAAAFDRRLAGETLDFGSTGNLRYSNPVMWDRQTESWWQQATGQGLVGTMAGRRLDPISSSIIPFSELLQEYPAVEVLSRETGVKRLYGETPYSGLDDVRAPPFLFSGTYDARLRPMEPVVGVSLGSDSVAYTFSRLAQVGALDDVVGGQPIVVLYTAGTLSVLDHFDIGRSRAVGSATAFSRFLDGRALSFRSEGGSVFDTESGSRWSALGYALSGTFAGRRLTPIIHASPFWFAWYAFHPETRVWAE
jgi:uncharacterized protein DUF3179